MPTRICLEPRCPNQAVYRGRCAPCSTKHDRATHPRKGFYNTAKWKRTRRAVLHDQPLCPEPCGAIATDVDHIIAIEDGGNPWARSNLQALCHACHATKTNREVRSR